MSEQMPTPGAWPLVFSAKFQGIGTTCPSCGQRVFSFAAKSHDGMERMLFLLVSADDAKRMGALCVEAGESTDFWCGGCIREPDLSLATSGEDTA